MILDDITSLRPEPISSDELGAAKRPADIIASETMRRTRRRRFVVGVAAVCATGLTGSAALAAADVWSPRALMQSLASENGEEQVGDPVLTADFVQADGQRFTVWTAAGNDGNYYRYIALDWDGSEGITATSQVIVSVRESRHDAGNFSNGMDGPKETGTGASLYGLAPYPKATMVRVTAPGFAQDLPVNRNHGFGAALPGAEGKTEVSLVFTDPDGNELGGETYEVPPDFG